MKYISETKRNNSENIKELIKKYQENNNEDVFNELLKETRALRQYSINKIQKQSSITKQELEQECDIALYKAALAYDTQQNGKVTNYIINAMTRAMIRFVRTEQSIIHIPNNRLNANALIRTVINNYEKINGEPPDDDLLLEKIREKDKTMTINDIKEYYKTNLMGNQVSIDDIEYELPNISNIDDEREFMKEKLSILTNCLNEQEIELLKEIYYEDKSFSDISKEHNCSRENIRQKHDRILKKIRKYNRI